jgi:ring-1,2-phenylacetyl-CoA epoxidase subunit PaaE
MPPNGRFTKVCEPDSENQYVAFAAGSGITPIFSIIKTILHKEPKSTFRLFYINRNIGSIILREELEALKNTFMERLEIHYFLTQESRDMSIFNGRLDLEKLQVIFNQLIEAQNINDYFVCGPEEMIFMVRDYLIQTHGVAEKKVHFELFNSGNAKSNVVSQKKKTSAGPVSKVTVINNGITSSFEMPQEGESILDAALRNNGDLPFACKGGVCCTCRAKVTEGDVIMDVNYALEKEEVADGYVLTCQSHPTSDKVLVDFDK